MIYRDHQKDRVRAAYYQGVRASITWLHDRANEMNDPHAQRVLNSAAFDLRAGKDTRDDLDPPAKVEGEGSSQSKPVSTPKRPPEEPCSDGCRPEVCAFANLMEAQLRANDHKAGWKGENPWPLLDRLFEEARELGDELQPGSRSDRTLWTSRVGAEAADVANFALMIADVCGALDGERKIPMEVTMLSPENRGVVERQYPDYVPQQIRDAEGFLDALLDAARAESQSELLEMLKEAILQIEYLHGRFQETGSGNGVIARARSAIARAEGLPSATPPHPQPDAGAPP